MVFLASPCILGRIKRILNIFVIDQNLMIMAESIGFGEYGALILYVRWEKTLLLLLTLKSQVKKEIFNL
jgi:hypothetical protein